MKTIKVYLSCIIFITLILQNCSSDYTENLGNDYFYRNEGGIIKDILCKKANGGEIPATVIEYNYNNDFIIAKQKPKLPQDPLYDKTYKYNLGENVLYYWLIDKENQIVYGPLNIEEFNKVKVKLKVPNELKLTENK
jgi:hypothetical protein